MSVRNVGIVFSPTLNIPAPVFAAFLTDFDAIFGAEPPEESSTTIEVTAASPLTPEDIRSPRHQMFSDIPTPAYNQESFPQKQQHGLGMNFVEFHPPPGRDGGLGGFIPLQPSYESSNGTSISLGGPEYGAVHRASNIGLGATSIMRDTKARRRESSMLMMGMPASHRQPSMASMREANGQSIYDDTRIDRPLTDRIDRIFYERQCVHQELKVMIPQPAQSARL